MKNIMLLYDPKSDGAEFAWGAWTAELPLENLASRRLHEVSRSVDAAPDSTRFTVALPAAETLRAVVLGPMNVSMAYRCRVRAYTDPWFEPPVYDGDWYAPFDGAGGGALGLEWEDPYFWLGNKPYEDAERGVWLVHILPEAVTAQWWSIEIEDPDNVDGFIEAGRLFLARSYIPSLNYSYSGNGLRFRNNSRAVALLSGGKQVRRRVNPRQFAFAFDYLPEAEGFSDLYRLMRLVGFDRECFVIPDPEDTAHMQERAFLGRMEEMDAISQAVLGCVGTTMQIEEII